MKFRKSVILNINFESTLESMGIQGLFKYLLDNNLSESCKFRQELRSWRRSLTRKFLNKKPIIVIDFKCFVYRLMREARDVICGGRHKMIVETFENVLEALEGIECELVFFSDWMMTESKIEKWLERERQEFDRCVEFYNAVDVKKHFALIDEEIKDMKPLNSIFYDIELIAQKYGKLYYSVDGENDVKLARYATENDAFAVISEDSDFLIFDGNWAHFSFNGVTKSSMIKVIKRKKKQLREKLSLIPEEMPLSATLLANDIFIEKIFERVEDAAEFARGKSLLPIDEIISQLPDQNINLEKFQNSLDSYNINFDDEPMDDEFGRTLRENGHKMYRFYKVLLGSIHGISLPFYDMNENNPKISLSELIIRWMRRKIGILHNHKRRKGEFHRFRIIAKRTFEGNISCLEDSPEYPNDEDFLLPKLTQLYLEDEPSAGLIETKWNILKWIMSFTDGEMSTIRKIKEEFRMVGAILCALLKENLLNTKEADGILCTEYKNSNVTSDNVVFPTILNSKCVRAAHKYNIVFSPVRENFFIAGLSSYVEESLKFDGFYFQTLMIKFMEISDADRHVLMKPIKNDIMLDDETEFDLF